MEVSFTGIQNVGGFKIEVVKGTNVHWSKLIVQLTDKESKDLSEFRDVFEKFPDKLMKNNFIRLETIGSDTSIKKKPTNFFLNYKELYVNDENLKFFSKIAKLLEKVKDSKEKILVDKDYLNSNHCEENIRFLNLLSNHFGNDFADRFMQEYPTEKIYNFNNAKKVANSIYEDLNQALLNFFK